MGEEAAEVRVLAAVVARGGGGDERDAHRLRATAYTTTHATYATAHTAISYTATAFAYAATDTAAVVSDTHAAPDDVYADTNAPVAYTRLYANGCRAVLH